MTRTGAQNVYPIAIEGTFDDAQKTVKDIFADLSFRKQVGLSAVNSINLARILAQSVYYLFAWLKLSRSEARLLSLCQREILVMYFLVGY